MTSVHLSAADRTTSPGAAPPDAAWRQLREAATAPYRAVSPFAWRFARGKLTRDPVFRALLQRGDLGGRHRVVDIGCGQGLLASLLQACNDLQRRGAWPARWPAAPAVTQYTGVELMPRDVARAEHALQGLPLAPAFVCGDMCTTPLPACDTVVILDVLHYVPHAAQADVLHGVLAALRQGLLQGQQSGQGAHGVPGRLLLRVGDAGNTRPFAISQWVDRTVTRIRGHRAPPTWGRTLADWTALLHALGFHSVRSVPMSQGTPFANVLLVADLQTPDVETSAPHTGAPLHPDRRPHGG